MGARRYRRRCALSCFACEVSMEFATLRFAAPFLSALALATLCGHSARAQARGDPRQRWGDPQRRCIQQPANPDAVGHRPGGSPESARDRGGAGSPGGGRQPSGPHRLCLRLGDGERHSDRQHAERHAQDGGGHGGSAPRAAQALFALLPPNALLGCIWFFD